VIVDTHVHLVDPGRHPIPPGPGYKPRPDERGTAAELDAALAAAGVTHAVLVALSGYGVDHRPVLDGLAGRADRRGVVNLLATPTGRELDALVAAGVAGMRVNLSNFGEAAIRAARRALPALTERGLVVQLQCPAGRLAALDSVLASCPERVVLDHLGLPDVAAGPKDPGFRHLLRWGERGAVIKFSGAFRVSRTAFPHDDLLPFVAALRAAFPAERRVWGSDWPFVGTDRAPSYAQTLELARRWCPEREEQHLMFAATPAALFGFAQDGGGGG
jgi:predicted TIM-barrel fold metal-dependent hydrolase